MNNKATKIEELQETCERYELAVSAANMGMFDWDTSSDVVYYSKIYKSQIGYEQHELEDKLQTWIDHLHPDETEEVQKKSNDFLKNPEGEYENEFRFRHKNGSYIWILARAKAVRDENGRVVRLYGSHTDITTRKEMEQKIEAISNQSSDGITIADMDGNYVYVNPAFCAMSGYSEEELLQMTVFDMKAANQDHSSFQKTKESPQIITVVLQKKDGTEYYSEIVGDVIVVNNEKLVLGTIRDVTDRVNAEKEIRKLNDNLEQLVEDRTKELNATVEKLNLEIEQRVAAEQKIQESLTVKEVLLKEITHRVKNNFQIISSLIRLQKRGVKNAEVGDLLDQIANRIQSMALIHETLHKANTFDDVVFKEYIESLIEYIKTISNNPDIEINEEICDCTLPIADATNLGMIIMELVTNSLKYAFPNEEKGIIMLKMEQFQNGYKLTVSDNGVGMSKDIDFRNTESLGMQVVVSLTEQLGASINLLDQPTGTGFEILI